MNYLAVQYVLLLKVLTIVWERKYIQGVCKLAEVHAVLLDVRFVLLQTVDSTMRCAETEFLRSLVQGMWRNKIVWLHDLLDMLLIRFRACFSFIIS
jgi:hypothetical protein